MSQNSISEVESRKILGDARYQRYLLDSNGQHDAAMQLHLWNIEPSTHFYKLLSVFELTLRNAIDQQLRVWNAENFSRRAKRISPTNHDREPSSWTLNSNPIIWRTLLNKRDTPVALKSAYRKAEDDVSRSCRLRGVTVTHDDMVAHMTFGNWYHLLPRNNQDSQTLWQQAIRKGFPGWDPREWKHLTRRVLYATTLRNRISHLEPITHFNLRQTRRGIRTIAYSMGPAAFALVKQADQTLKAIDSFPLDRALIDWRDDST